MYQKFKVLLKNCFDFNAVKKKHVVLGMCASLRVAVP